MQNTIYTITICALLSTALSAQTVVDFESANLAGNRFMAGGFEWEMTGDFLISEFEDFSCDGSPGLNRYMDSGYLDGPSQEQVGSIAPLETTVTFQMSTTASQCVWVGSGDGEFVSTGTITFTGVKLDDNVVEESFELTSLGFSELLPVDFSPATWQGVELASLQVAISDTQDSTDYVAIDNLVFAEIATPTDVQSVETADIAVFPNPTSGLLFLQHTTAAQVFVYDPLGQIVQHETIPRQQIDLTALPPGMYLLKIQQDDRWYTTSVVKQ